MYYMLQLMLVVMQHYATCDYPAYLLYAVAVKTKLLSPVNGENKNTISSEGLFTGEEFPKMSIQVPSELIEEFADSDGNDGVVRAVSYLYYNVEGLFPSDLPGKNE